MLQDRRMEEESKRMELTKTFMPCYMDLEAISRMANNTISN